MGSPVGVFTDDEVKNLTPEDKAMLKEHILRHIQTSKEILDIIDNNPNLLTKDQGIKDILRKKAEKLRDRLTR